MSKTIGLILAAGQSERMGFQKAFIKLNHQPILRLHLNLFRRHCAETKVITGFGAENIRAWLRPTEEVYNKDWSISDMKDSILLGLEGLSPNDRALITPVDTLPAHDEEIEMLLQTRTESVLSHNGQAGHPFIGTRSKLTGILNKFPLCFATDSFFKIPCKWDCTLNFNTPKDWKRHFGAWPEIYKA